MAKVIHNIHLCNCPQHTAIKIENLSVELSSVKILDNITASIPAGVCTAIVGPNGAGKSTLAKAVLGFIKPSVGKVVFAQNGSTFSSRPPRWGYVPQKLQFDRNMPLTVMEYLASGISKVPLFWKISSRVQNKILNMLDSVESLHLAGRQLGKLSGGELQRVLLAQALLQEPQILVLDEPASGVDFQGDKLCCGLLDKFRKERNFTQIMISHDLATVAAHAAHVICINHRLIAAGHPSQVLTAGNLRAAFGAHAILPRLPDHKKVCLCLKH